MSARLSALSMLLGELPNAIDTEAEPRIKLKLPAVASQETVCTSKRPTWVFASVVCVRSTLMSPMSVPPVRWLPTVPASTRFTCTSGASWAVLWNVSSELSQMGSSSGKVPNVVGCACLSNRTVHM